MNRSTIKNSLVGLVLAGSLLTTSGCTALRLYYPIKSLSEAAYHCINDDKKEEPKLIKYDSSIVKEK